MVGYNSVVQKNSCECLNLDFLNAGWMWWVKEIRVNFFCPFFSIISYNLDDLYCKGILMCGCMQSPERLVTFKPEPELVSESIQAYQSVGPYVCRVSLYSIYRLPFWSNFDEVWHTDVFWSKGQPYWKWFRSYYFFDHFLYNALIWKVDISITARWYNIFNSGPCSTIECLLVLETILFKYSFEYRNLIFMIREVFWKFPWRSCAKLHF